MATDYNFHAITSNMAFVCKASEQEVQQLTRKLHNKTGSRFLSTALTLHYLITTTTN